VILGLPFDFRFPKQAASSLAWQRVEKLGLASASTKILLDSKVCLSAFFNTLLDRQSHLLCLSSRFFDGFTFFSDQRLCC